MTVPFRGWRALCYVAFGAWYWPDYIVLFSIGALFREFEAGMILRDGRRQSWSCGNWLFFCIASEKWLAMLHFLQFDTVHLHMFAAVLIVLCVLTWDFLQNILSSALGRWLGRITSIEPLTSRHHVKPKEPQRLGAQTWRHQSKGEAKAARPQLARLGR